MANIFFPCKRATSSVLHPLILLSALLFFYFVLASRPCAPPPPSSLYSSPSSPTSPRHIVFGIASSAASWPRRSHYVRLWWRPGLTRGFVFLDRAAGSSPADDSLPPVRISADTSRFPYTFPGGLRSAVRIARIVSEVVGLELPDVRWVVLGDDDTVFVPRNLARVLAKYDHEKWFYVGSNSEGLEQNLKHSFDMAFGGGGFAISYPLARVLARVMDSCLVRYAHLYGSDARVYSCLAELGVGLTREPGFHQIDIRGNIYGFLASHPLAPLVSLHHLDYVDPIFPSMKRSEALAHLFKAIEVDSSQILQQAICYDHAHSLTISVSWGYSVQVFEGNMLLPDLLSLQKTFTPWKRGRNIVSSQYVLKTRDFPSDPCMQPATFFLESVLGDLNGTHSSYGRHMLAKCKPSNNSASNLKWIKVSVVKLQSEVEQLQAPRRRCCDVLSSPSGKILELGIRQCKDEELISMHP